MHVTLYYTKVKARPFTANIGLFYNVKIRRPEGVFVLLRKLIAFTYDIAWKG
jgi:hypothetical protein